MIKLPEHYNFVLKDIFVRFDLMSLKQFTNKINTLIEEKLGDGQLTYLLFKKELKKIMDITLILPQQYGLFEERKSYNELNSYYLDDKKNIKQKFLEPNPEFGHKNSSRPNEILPKPPAHEPPMPPGNLSKPPQEAPPMLPKDKDEPLPLTENTSLSPTNEASPPQIPDSHLNIDSGLNEQKKLRR